MQFCSDCGNRLPELRDGQRRVRPVTCVGCGTTHYENPRIIVSCIVCWNNQILVCRRAQDPGRGRWAVPAGFLECGETLEECAVRELQEETGATVDPDALELYSVTNMTALDQVAVAFRVTMTEKPHFRAGPECLDVAFMSEMDIGAVDFAWRRSMGDSLERLYREMRIDDFSIKLATLGSDDGVGFRSHRYGIRSVSRDETQVGKGRDCRDIW